MNFEIERGERLLSDLQKLIYKKSQPIKTYKVHDSKRPDGAFCDTSNWDTYMSGELWNCKDAYRWYRTTITVPEAFQTEQIDFVVSTGREGEWDATNPQMLLYVNGEIKQGLDVNHRYVVLSDSAKQAKL